MTDDLDIAGSFDARILHVEEYDAWRVLTKRALEQIDVDLNYVKALTPEEGIKKLENEGPFDGVITAGCGLEVVKAVKAMSNPVPVIMLATDTKNSNLAEEARKQGAEFISKHQFGKDFGKLVARAFYNIEI